MEQLELPLDHEESQNQLAILWADEAAADGENWDAAYESAWCMIENGDL